MVVVRLLMLLEVAEDGTEEGGVLVAALRLVQWDQLVAVVAVGFGKDGLLFGEVVAAVGCGVVAGGWGVVAGGREGAVGDCRGVVVAVVVVSGLLGANAHGVPVGRVLAGRVAEVPARTAAAPSGTEGRDSWRGRQGLGPVVGGLPAVGEMMGASWTFCCLVQGELDDGNLLGAQEAGTPLIWPHWECPRPDDAINWNFSI